MNSTCMLYSACLPSSQLSAAVLPPSQRSVPANSCSCSHPSSRRHLQYRYRKLALKRPCRSRQEINTPHASLQNTLQPLCTRDVTATLLAGLGAYIWVRLFDWLATQGVLEQVASLHLCLHASPCFSLNFLVVDFPCVLQHRLLAEN